MLLYPFSSLSSGGKERRKGTLASPPPRPPTSKQYAPVPHSLSDNFRLCSYRNLSIALGVEEKEALLKLQDLVLGKSDFFRHFSKSQTEINRFILRKCVTKRSRSSEFRSVLFFDGQLFFNN